jgi:hypothetical protein
MFGRFLPFFNGKKGRREDGKKKNYQRAKSVRTIAVPVEVFMDPVCIVGANLVFTLVRGGGFVTPGEHKVRPYEGTL